MQGTSRPSRRSASVRLFADLDPLDDHVAVIVVGLDLLDEAVRLIAIAVIAAKETAATRASVAETMILRMGVSPDPWG
jgi:hypothetical protein